MANISIIPLQSIPNQQLTFGINGQTFNITITSATVNNKRLLMQTPDIDANTKIYTFASIFLGTQPIIQTTICKHAYYLNPYPSLMKGYLFFYVNGADKGGADEVLYTNFNINTNLYYADYNALALNNAAWIANNKQSLAMKYVYGN